MNKRKKRQDEIINLLQLEKLIFKETKKTLEYNKYCDIVKKEYNYSKKKRTKIYRK